MPEAGARPAYTLAAWLFLRALGLVDLLAFGSLWLQLHGLIGSRGILPAAPYLARVAETLGAARFHRLPTLCWLGAGDGFLHLLCAAGVAASVAVLAGRFQVPALAAAWALYLSLVGVGRDFLGFQWDNLLLECGLIAVFLVPPARRARPRAPSPLAWWLLRWLLFRLMFASGLVKLSSGDPAWRHLEALRYHYETQPLPTWVGWWAHQLPASVQAASALAMFAIELAVPFALFLPARFRRWAAAPFLMLQGLIAVTGNYGFFNLLSTALLLTLLDDAAFPARWRPAEPPSPSPRRWTLLAVPLAAVVAVVTPVQLASAFRLAPAWPSPVLAVYRLASPFRSINGYGLFAVMTTERPELVIEGSADGRTWRPYRLRFKPQDLDRRPAFVAPHMPRLDWQLWFAALGDVRRNPWLVAFLARLAEGSPPVRALLADDPFPDTPPRYLRVRRFRYRFTDRRQRRASGLWWQREETAPYLPATPAEQLIGYGR